MLPAGAAAEVLAPHHDVARLHPGDEGLVNVLHAVVRQLPGILGVQVAGGDDDVGVDVVTVFEYRTSCFHGVQTSLGSVMWPVRALAAAVAGLAR